MDKIFHLGKYERSTLIISPFLTKVRVKYETAESRYTFLWEGIRL